MKRYKVRYFYGDRSKPDCITEISKSGRWDGVKISFWYSEKKDWQAKFKNGLRNGIVKTWCYKKANNDFFVNWKKGKSQGIEIIFKKW